MNRNNFGRPSAPGTGMKTPNKALGLGGRHSVAVPPSTGKKRSDAPRFSVGGPPPSASRRTSVFGRASMAPVKDTRPMNDASYKAAMVKKVFDFLCEDPDGPPFDVSVVRQPSKAQFATMFNLITEHIDPQFQLQADGKTTVEEEVPKVLVGLGYPYSNSIKSSTLQTVGAPHTWPYLLSALCWLIDMTRICEQIHMDSIFAQCDESSLQVMLTMFKVNSFQQYRPNRATAADDKSIYNKCLQDLRRNFEDTFDMTSHNNELQQQEQAIAKEMDELHRSEAKFVSLNEDIARIGQDAKVAGAYADKYRAAMAGMQPLLDSAKKDRDEQKERIEEFKKQVEHKKFLIAEQAKGADAITGAEARAIGVESEQERVRVAELRARLEQLSKDDWKINTALKQQLHVELAEFCRVCDELDRVRSDLLEGAENTAEMRAAGHRLQPANAKELAEACSDGLTHKIHEVRQAAQHRLASLCDETERCRKEVDEAVAHAHALGDEMETRRRNGERENRKRDRERDGWAAAVAERQQETVRLENEIEAVEMARHGKENLRRELERLSSSAAAEKEEWKAIMVELDEKLTEKVERLYERIQSIRDHQQSMEDTMLKLEEEFGEDMFA